MYLLIKIIHKQVFEESLRLFPPAPIFGKISLEGTSLLGYDIPKNTETMVSRLTGVHHEGFTCYKTTSDCNLQLTS